MIKTYKFQYDYWCDIIFEVDTDKYTEELALATLEFFYWTWNNQNDPIIEVLKKISIQCLSLSLDGYSVLGIIDEFDNKEGFPKLDGSNGLTLVRIDDFELNENNLSLEIIE